MPLQKSLVNRWILSLSIGGTYITPDEKIRKNLYRIGLAEGKEFKSKRMEDGKFLITRIK